MSDVLRRALLDWYRAVARSLPWRDRPEPYRVWVSEIMLQQTQVDTVIPYFERWMARFPTPEALATAPIDDVLAHWSGLGYYRRAHNLHRAASVVVEAHGGRLPADHAALLKLPGIGRYTAGAIASIAFGLPFPVVDGNVVRVLARLRGLEGDPSRTDVQRRIWDTATALLDTSAPGDFNQALMELGALVCRPRAPLCDGCPLREHCVAFATERQHELPTPKRRRTRHREVAAALLVRVESTSPSTAARYLVARRNADLLAGLWSLPSVELLRIEGGQRDPAAARDEVPGATFFGPTTRERVHALAREVLGERAPEAEALRPLGPVEHGFTHIEYTLVPWLCAVTSDDDGGLAVHLDPAAWSAHRLIEPAELASMGVPRMIERVFEQL